MTRLRIMMFVKHMKAGENKWKVILKGNGKYYCRVENNIAGSYWPFWSPNEFDTLDEAKLELIAKKEEFDKISEQYRETVVFEL